ncbi:hypothetical protein [Draconibacterium mangrovi]|uniref:hypothetical protein n=1 Tax=Draconibacterium mangrovi TaxID=2697469 RepID=UPI0013D335DB|nr:hypothetical protein [Draconibacterium mangrovi]
MKKLLYIVLIVSVLPLFLSAQDGIFSNTPSEPAMLHSKRDFSIFVSTGYLSANNPYNSSLSGGIKMRMFLGERFSFDSGFLIGEDHSQWGIGTIGLPLWMLGMGVLADEEDDIGTEFWTFVFFGLTMLLSSEHIAYHIPTHNNIEISPYVSFLRFKQFSNVVSPEHPDGYDGATCFALGMELNTYFNKFIVAPYVDYNIAYSGNFRGFNVGINLGYYLPTKRK